MEFYCFIKFNNKIADFLVLSPILSLHFFFGYERQLQYFARVVAIIYNILHYDIQTNNLDALD